MFWFRLPPATKAPRGRLSPCRGAEENGKKKRQKPVGWDKGSLTEQQTKGTVTTTIEIRRKHDKTDCTTEPLSQTTPPLHAPEPPESSRCAAPSPTGTQHAGTWYGIPCSVWPGWGWVSPPGCAPSCILLKINPVLDESRTCDHAQIFNSSCLLPMLCALVYRQIRDCH